MFNTKKEKKKFFTKMEFDDVQYATNVKEKCEEKFKRVKCGLIMALISEVFWAIVFIFPSIPDTLWKILVVAGIVAALTAYIYGGGMLTAITVSLKVATTLGYIGWVLIPFPFDIITGLWLTIVAIILVPLLFLCLPIVLVFVNYIQVKKDYKAAEEYLNCFKPVETV